MSIPLLLLRRLAWRHWQLAPVASGLLVLILALGVAVFFAIRLANRAAVNSFQHFTELVTTQTDWILQAAAGDLPEGVLPEIRGALGEAPVVILPVVESTATRPPEGGGQRIGARETFRLLGLDLIGIQNFASGAPSAAGQRWFTESTSTTSEDSRPDDQAFWRTLGNPRAVFISGELAARSNLRIGDPLPLIINDALVTLEVAGVLPRIPDRPAAPAGLMVLDLPALQRWTGREGRLSRIEFVVEPGPRADQRRADLRAVLERLAATASVGSAPLSGAEAPRWFITTSSERREAGEMMTRAFRLNLTILSLLALLVGLYLVVQALDGAVVRRRAEIAILRSLGVEEGMIRAAWLIEAGVLGLAGGLGGVVLGWLGAQVSVRFVGQTVNALYYATSADTAQLTAGEFVVALGVSVAASLLAGWIPARAAAQIPPAQILGRQGATSAPNTRRAAALGMVIGLAACGCALLPPLRFAGGARFPLAGYAAALGWIFAGGLLGAWLLSGMAHAGAALGSRSATLRIAASHLLRPTSRHVLATAGLICAVAMTAGMIILVGSFDRTMRGWIERTFQSDLYVSSAGAQSASTDNRIQPTTWRAVSTHPGIAEINVMHAMEIRLQGIATVLIGSDLGFAERHAPPAWVVPPDSGQFAAASQPHRATPEDPALVFVSESFQERFRLGVGGSLVIPTASGPRHARIAGIFADYGNERGSIVVERTRFTEWFHTDLASSLIIKLHPGVDPEGVRSEWLRAHPGLQIFTNSHLRAEVLRIFRQTFAITYALEAIGMVVAVLGLAMTLVSLLLERRSELTTLRALGMTRAELARAAGWEGLQVGLAGLSCGLAISLLLGWLLIRVINKQTFGWTLQFELPVGALALLSGLVLASAAVTSLLVGRWGSQLPAEREEE
ncbi:MAG: FtsX-like permease family protein [Verrucomicrobiales bacterium]|nr:FtsX-like permease family protein [Verrucomicrobiales bacterium]